LIIVTPAILSLLLISIGEPFSCFTGKVCPREGWVGICLMNLLLPKIIGVGGNRLCL
jgi:hypothetical protein